MLKCCAPQIFIKYNTLSYNRFESQTTRRRQTGIINSGSEIVTITMVADDDDDDGDSKLGYLSDKMHKIRLRL